MMKTEIITKMEELLSRNAGDVANEMRTLQKEYQKLWTNEFELAKQNFIDEGGKAKEFTYDKSLEDKHISDLIEKYNKLKKEEDNKIAQEQNKNLLVRQEIIAKINDLSQVSTNVGAAMKKLQELQTQWKETGAVSPHKYKEVQADYSKAIENIYYNLKIFRELQEHDLKKNYSLKQELIEKIKLIKDVENAKEAERLIKVYRNDWEDIGPVPNEKWEELKAIYKTVLDEAYSKVKAFYNSIEEMKEANLASKKELVEKLKTITSSEPTHVSKWNELTNQVIEIQNEWKTIGRTNQKDNDQIWAEFREVCDGFFNRKKEYFNSLHEQQAEVKKIKLNLIEKAEALQGSTDWQKTSQDLIKLQESWKKQHLVNERDEAKLFFKFRKACNAFFDAKKAHQDIINTSLEQNIKAKEELIQSIVSFVLSDNSSENLKQLKQFSSDWNAAGQIPFKERKRLNETFYNRLDELYEQLNLNQSEKLLIQFRNKIERLVSADNAADLLKREADYLKKQMDDINANIKKYENNMGFFKNAKSDNPLFKEVNEKIDAEKQKLQDFTAKRKIVTEELNKLRQSAELK